MKASKLSKPKSTSIEYLTKTKIKTKNRTQTLDRFHLYLDPFCFSLIGREIGLIQII